MCDLNELVRDGKDKTWTNQWNRFHASQWFQERLDRSARLVLKRAGLPIGWRDDVKQEALVIFARVLQRKPTLGFDPSRGTAEPLVATIIYRCCQKGLKQFRNCKNNSLEHEPGQASFDPTRSLDDQMDLEVAIDRLDEPYRSTVRRIVLGQSIDEIADSTDRSNRTIYRHLERATELLKDQMEPENRLSQQACGG